MKTLINEFIKGRHFEFGKLEEITTIYDDEEGEICDIVFSDCNSQWEVKMYLNEDCYEFEDIEKSEIDENIKKQIYDNWAQLQEELDNDKDSPNYEDDNDTPNSHGLNFLIFKRKR